MANRFLTNDMLAKDGLIRLVNKLGFSRMVYRQHEKDFKHVGDTVRVKLPVNLLTHNTQNITNKIQNYVQRSINMVVGTWTGVALDILASDLSLNITDFMGKIGAPAMEQIADKVDENGLKEYVNVAQGVGAPGTRVAAILEIAVAGEVLDEMACPKENRRIVVGPKDNTTIQNTLHTSLLYAGKPQAAALVKGYMGTLVGMGPVFNSNHVVTHTPGGAQTNVTVYATLTNASTLSQVQFTGSDADIKKGDSFTIEDVYSVNPRSKASTGTLQKFTVTSDVTDADPMTIPISPSIIMSDDLVTNNGPQYQNVNSYPVAGKDITFYHTSNSTAGAANLVFHKNAFGLVTVPIAVPFGFVNPSHRQFNGLSITVATGSDILQYKGIIRFDVLYGWKTLYPELACRLAG